MLIGLASGVATLAGMWSVFGRLGRWWLRLGLALAITCVGALPVVRYDWFVKVMVSSAIWPPTLTPTHSFWCLLNNIFLGFILKEQEDELTTVWVPILLGVAWAVGCVIWLWVGLVGAVGGRAAKPHRFAGDVQRRVAGTALLVLGVLLLVPPVGVYYRLMTPLPIPEVTMPDPNGYDDIVAAYKLTKNVIFEKVQWPLDKLSQKELATVLKNLEPAFKRLRVGLSRPTRFPVDYTLSEKGRLLIFPSFPPYVACESVASALNGLGRLAKLEGRHEDAADRFLETIQFGYVVRRDVFMDDHETGSYCSKVGAGKLFNLRDRLAPQKCAALITALIELEQQAEPDEDVIHRERILWQHANGWTGHLEQIIEELLPGETRFDTRRSDFIELSNRDRATMRLLRMELALRAWRVKYRSLPELLTDLVPEFVPAVPIDPCDPQGAPLRYFRTEEDTKKGYVLYSVGYDGEDDGGIPRYDESLDEE